MGSMNTFYPYWKCESFACFINVLSPLTFRFLEPASVVMQDSLKFNVKVVALEWEKEQKIN